MTTNLNQWAIKHHIGMDALEDLRQMMGVINTDPQQPVDGLSEAANVNNVRLEATSIGSRLWRNNVGAALTPDGVPVRYGLCNDSAKMNKTLKSSDLIGIRPVMITLDMVGSIIGQFLAREIKPGDWRYSATEHEQAQLKFLELVLSMGGDAAFANSRGTL